MLLDPADFCQSELELFVHPRAGMLKSHSLGFNPIHQNNSHSGERIVIQFARRHPDYVVPIELLFFQWNAFSLIKPKLMQVLSLSLRATYFLAVLLRSA
jgi:hypothetical protein